jgi:uncharacterized protein (DUF2267 family)
MSCKKGMHMGEGNEERIISDERSAFFFRNVKRALGISSNQSIISVVGKVLTQVCRNLPKQQAYLLISRLPGMFHPLLYKESDQGTQQSYSHLDELVENMYEEDRRSEHPQFATEVEALNAVVVVLRKLDKYLNIFSYNILKPRWVEGLRQIPLEDAA